MQIFGDKVVAFEILKFLDLEDTQKCQLVFPEIRKLLKEKSNKIHYLCKRYNLMSVDEIHNHIIPEHEYLNEIHRKQLDQKIWWKAAIRCVKNLHHQIEAKSGLKIYNADEHRSKGNHENICLDNQIQCKHCRYMDPQDVRKIFTHLFSTYPLSFVNHRANTRLASGLQVFFITHDPGTGVLATYIYDPFAGSSPYGNVASHNFKLFIKNDILRKYQTLEKRNNYSLNPNYILTEEDLTAIKRALLIPKWYLQKYFEYIVDVHDGLYQYVVKCANPGREQRLKLGDVKVYLNCALYQGPPMM